MIFLRPFLPSFPSFSVPFFSPAKPRQLELCQGKGLALAAAAVLLAMALGGCASAGKVFAPQEKFSSVATYSRLFDANPEQTCEAARRALLSQGYIVHSESAELVEGKKNFQPEADSHLQMMIRVVCVPETVDGTVSLGFVTALQEAYTLKKTNNSASLGVGGVGSVSLPFITGGGESLVKVGSQTIADNEFYENFFDLMKRYLLSADALQQQHQAQLSSDNSGSAGAPVPCPD